MIALTSTSPPFPLPLPPLLPLTPLPLPLLTSVVAPVIVNLTAIPFTGVPQGSPLNLTCEAVGVPILNVTWTTPTGLRVGSVISVDNVTADDAGEYRCEVTSEAGTTNDSITIRGESSMDGHRHGSKVVAALWPTHGHNYLRMTIREEES